MCSVCGIGVFSLWYWCVQSVVLVCSVCGIGVFSSRVTAHMYNTEDSESSLSHIEWRIGTATGAHDIMPARRVEICRHMTVKVTNPLPLDKRIYSTVKVFNKAG